MILHLSGELSFYLPDHPSQVDLNLKAPVRLTDVLAGLGIPPAEIGLAVVNGELVDLQSAIVTHQDVVKLYPPVSGG